MELMNYFGELLFWGIDWPQAVLVLVAGIISVAVCISVIVVLKRIGGKRLSVHAGKIQESKEVIKKEAQKEKQTKLSSASAEEIKLGFRERFKDPFNDFELESIYDPLLKVKIFFKALRKDHEKDGIILSSFYPYGLDQKIVSDLSDGILQIQSIKVLDIHSIYIVKSAASSVYDFLEILLQRFFKELNNKYYWEKIPQEIKVEAQPNLNVLVFKTNLNLYPHTELRDRLTKVHGLFSNPYVNKSGVFWGIGDKNITAFGLEKQEENSWLELRPKIMKIIESYFSTGVTWKGEWERRPRIKIQVLKKENPHVLSFSLPEGFETKNHYELGLKLMNLCSIAGGNKKNGLPLNIENPGPEFFLEKDKDWTWIELKPRIRKAFESYFLDDIIWAGAWPDDI